VGAITHPFLAYSLNKSYFRQLFFALLRAIFVCMNLLREKIVRIAEKITSDEGFILIDVLVRGNERNRVIEVFIDGESNITADDCAGISQKLNDIVEGDKIITSPYRLDVSSPGIDRPLLYLKQYSKHIDREFEVFYKSAEIKKKLKGRLKNISGEQLTFLTDREIVINFNDIIKAKVLISFS
jgi:ribosome maturation factor RimP